MSTTPWGIAVHTAAAPGNVESSADAIRRYHRDILGWRDIGYHDVIRKDGLVQPGRKLDDDAILEWDEVGAGVAGGNTQLIHVVCTGHGDIADFTDDQHRALAELCVRRIKQFGWPDESRVIGHREAEHILGTPPARKTCPGKKVDMDKIREHVRLKLAQWDVVGESAPNG